MTTAIFWRFFWKEYRVMRAFWISMACLAMLAQLSLVAFPGLTHSTATWTFSFALIFPALYAVACGATMFAAEKEDGTYDFLRDLPATVWRILAGKVAFAVASSVLLVVALWITAAILSQRATFNSSDRLQIWGAFGLAGAEGLAWGIFFSLLLRRPLQAAVLAIAAASLALHLVLSHVAPVTGEGQVYEFTRYVAAVPVRIALVALVFVVDGLLARRWLVQDTSTVRRLFLRRLVAPTIEPPMVEARTLARPRRVVIGRLLWQTWRQSRWMMVILAGPGTVIAMFASALALSLSQSSRASDIVAYVVGAAAVLVGALMGAATFLGDNECRSVRFLAERGVRARHIWLARELGWLAALAIWMLFVSVVAFGHHGGAQAPILGAAMFLAAAALLTIVGFACGQLASMLIRSGIIAATVAVVLVLVCTAWAILMRLLGISLLWSVFPIPMALFIATWLRAPDWLLERNTWRGWLKVGAVLIVPLTALLTAVPVYRIEQIPDVSPGFAPEAYAHSIKPSKAAEETADMCVQAVHLLNKPRQNADGENRARPPDAGDLAYLHANAEALALALEAGQRPEWSFHGVNDPIFWENYGALAHLLDVSARQLESEGKLDEAWERWMATLRFESRLQDSPVSYYQLPFWAKQPGQTRERIVAAIKQLAEFETTLRPPTYRLKDRYLTVESLVTGGPEALAGHVGSDDASHLILSMLPWERRRALRLLSVLTAEDLRELDYFVSGIAEGTPVTRLLWYVKPPADNQYAEWLKTTPLLSRFFRPGGIGEQLGREFASETNFRRATHLLMALEAWKADHHGELPERLDQLVGPYLEKLPLDPFTSRDYVYEPRGVEPPDRSRRNWPFAKPFIWSPGVNVRPSTPARSDVTPDDSWPGFRAADVMIRDVVESPWHRASDEFDIWLAGVRFEIP
jgi:ABC-type transport system involved in multi-copper enzyme maturation permease subunit